MQATGVTAPDVRWRSSQQEYKPEMDNPSEMTRSLDATDSPYLHHYQSSQYDHQPLQHISSPLPSTPTPTSPGAPTQSSLKEESKTRKRKEVYMTRKQKALSKIKKHLNIESAIEEEALTTCEI